MLKMCTTGIETQFCFRKVQRKDLPICWQDETQVIKLEIHPTIAACVTWRIQDISMQRMKGSKEELVGLKNWKTYRKWKGKNKKLQINTVVTWYLYLLRI